MCGKGKSSWEVHSIGYHNYLPTQLARQGDFLRHPPIVSRRTRFTSFSDQQTYSGTILSLLH